MDARCAWELFVKTGSPEMYLLYSELKGKEGAYVSESAGPCASGDTL